MKKWLIIALPLLVAAGVLWWRMASPTRVALVDFQPFQAASIVRANNSRFVKYTVVSDLEKLGRYDFVLGFGMGMRITAEQRALLQKAAAKTPVYIHAATNPENAICSLDSVMLRSVQSYLDSGNKRNLQNLARFVRHDIDGKKWFAPPAEPAVETVSDVLYHLDEDVWFPDAADYEKYLHEKDYWQEGGARVAIVGGLNDPFSGNRENIDSLIMSFQRAGMNVYPVASAMQRLKFLKQINPDAVIYFPHGRVAMGQGDAVVEWLKARNIPMFAPLSMLQTHAEWEGDPQGLAGGFLSQSVVMPELDGAIYPYVVNAQEIDKDGIYLFKAIPERLAKFTKIVENFLKLKRKPNAEKRVAICYFGGAQGLELVPSLHNVLVRLRAEGYNVDHLPATAVELAEALKQPRVQLGNIALVQQPRAGVGGDDFAVLHGTKQDPPQEYIDAYLWVQNDFRADALLHFGTHGSLEFTPGKQVALSDNDWPDRLIGTVPHFYYYTIANVGEGMIAKRRSYATLISYLTPPFMASGLRGQMKALQTALAKNNAGQAQKIAVQMGIHRDLRLDSLQTWSPEQLEKVEQFAEELVSTRITGALYVVGQPYSEERIKSTAEAMGDKKYEAVLREAPEAEMRALVNALSGGYIKPSPGGDPLVSPNAVPTGRNLYAVNAETTPSEKAWESGVRLAKETLEAYKKEHGDYPRKVSYTLWSSEFIETEGATIAQVLYMLGVEPVRDAFGRVLDLRLIPATELGRPRVDVVVQTSGQLRDLAASRLTLISRAVEMAAADPASAVHESAVETERLLVEQGVPPKAAREMSTARVFGGVNGMYGTGIQAMTTAGDKWTDAKEIAEVYLNNMGAVYGSDKTWGDFQQGLLRAVLHNADVVVQPRQSNTWGALSLDHVYEFMGGMNLAVREVTGKDPDAYFADYRNRSRVRMQELKEAIGVESRTTLFNPEFIKEVMKGGASSAAQITEFATNTYGWSVMKPAVIDNTMWDKFYDVYVRDELGLGVEEFFRRESPQALQEITAVMLETARKGMWHATSNQLSTLASLHVDLVREFGAATSGMAASNVRLQDYIAAKAPVSAAAQYRGQVQQAAAKNGVVMNKEELVGAPAAEENTLNGALIAAVVVAVFIVILVVLRKKRKR